MSLKDRVIKAMKRKECEIPDLANAARVKAPSVHGWINGTSKTLKAGPAIRAAAYLGVNPLWLAEGEGDMLAITSYAIPSASAALMVKEPDNLPELMSELMTSVRKMNDRGLILLIDQAEDIVARHPKIKAKVA